MSVSESKGQEEDVIHVDAEIVSDEEFERLYRQTKNLSEEVDSLFGKARVDPDPDMEERIREDAEKLGFRDPFDKKGSVELFGHYSRVISKLSAEQVDIATSEEKRDPEMCHKLEQIMQEKKQYEALYDYIFANSMFLFGASKEKVAVNLKDGAVDPAIMGAISEDLKRMHDAVQDIRDQRSAERGQMSEWLAKESESTLMLVDERAKIITDARELGVENSRLRTDNKYMGTDNEALRQKVLDLRKRAARLRRDYLHMSEDAQNMADENLKLRNGIWRRDDKISRLREEFRQDLDRLNGYLASNIRDIERLVDEKEMQEGQDSSAAAIAAESSENQDHRKRKYSRWTTAGATALLCATAALGYIMTTPDEEKALEKQAAALSIKNEDLEDQINKEKARYAGLAEELDHAEDHADKLLAKNEEYEKSLEDAGEKLETAKASLSKAKDDLEALAEKNKSLDEKNNRYEDYLVNAVERVRTLLEENAEYKTALNNSQDNAETLAEENKRHEATIEFAEEAIKGLIAENEEYRDVVNRYKSDIRERNSDIARLSEQNSDYEDQNKMLDEKNSDYEGELVKAKDNITRLKELIAEKNGYISEADSRISALEAENSGYEMENDALSEQNESLKEKLEPSETETYSETAAVLEFSDKGTGLPRIGRSDNLLLQRVRDYVDNDVQGREIDHIEVRGYEPEAKTEEDRLRRAKQRAASGAFVMTRGSEVTGIKEDIEVRYSAGEDPDKKDSLEVLIYYKR